MPNSVKLSPNGPLSSSRTLSTPGATPFSFASAGTQRAQPDAPRLTATEATLVPCGHAAESELQLALMFEARSKPWPANAGWVSLILSPAIDRSIGLLSDEPVPPVWPAAHQVGAPTASVGPERVRCLKRGRSETVATS